MMTSFVPFLRADCAIPIISFVLPLTEKSTKASSSVSVEVAIV